MTEKGARIFIFFAFFILLLGILLFFTSTAPVHRWGDASTYYMQISSIVEDKDIQYQQIDLQRALDTSFDDLPAGVFLIRTAAGTYYFGKEFSYALFAAPFFKFLGIQGILIFNALMFWSMILMGFLYLRTKGNSDIVALGTSSLFFIVSTAFVYIFWVHSEIYIMFLLTLGLFLWTRYYEKPGSEKFLFCSAFLFGLATVSRIPNGLLFLPFLFYEVYSRRFIRALSLLILFLIPLLLFYGYFYAETGVTSFYGGDQSYYTSSYPFMDSSTGETGQITSATGEPGPRRMSMGDSLVHSAVNRLTLINYENGMSNLFYYFFGRFTGLIWYYPLAAFALISLLIWGISSQIPQRKTVNPTPGWTKNPTEYLILAGIILNILFFIVINGSNYFGGQHAVGNRYFWVYPAFLFLIGRVNLKLIIPFILIALVTVVPIVTDPVSNSQNPQSHTFNLPYPLFPLEKNQVHNLPLWFPQPSLQNVSFFFIDSEGGVVPEYLGSNTYSISGTSHWIIEKYSPIDQVSMIFINSGNEDSTVSIVYRNFTEGRVVEYSHPIKITLPLHQPEYYDTTRLNEISIRTPQEIKMMILSNETENQDVFYSDGWFDEEKDMYGSWRWMTSNSTLLVYSETGQDKSLQFEALSFNSPRNLLVQGEGIHSAFGVNPGSYSSITLPLHLQPGYTALQWNVPEGCTRPSDIEGLNNSDARCLSLMVRNTTIS